MTPFVRTLLSSTVLSLFLLPTSTKSEGKVLLCYYAVWSVYRIPPGDYHVVNVDPNLCTHLVYSYIGMNETTFKIQSRDPNGDFMADGNGLLNPTVALKQKNSKLKVMFSCGGWSEGSVKYSKMAASPNSRKIFIESVMEFIKKYKFDGMDMAWEYPAFRGGAAEDKQNFPHLLEELRQEFDKHGLILTAQLMSKRVIAEPGYDIPRVSKALHYISFVTYQYNIPESRRTGIHAPMKSNDDLNVEFSLDYLLRKGAPPEKILLGFSTYGHPYTMDEEVKEGGQYIGVAASTSYPGPWSQEYGYIGFNEVCYELTGGSKWKEHWDSESLTSFAVSGKKFMSYEDRRSYNEKLKLLKKKGLAGAMVWSIDTDDFKGLCYGERYPLIGMIKRFLEDSDGEIIHTSVNNENW